MSRFFSTFFALLLTLAAATTAEARILYVSQNNTVGPWTGRSWEEAYNSVATALNFSRQGDEIWVAAGVYTPNRTRDRRAGFRLKPGVSLYGGFAGHEAVRTDRDWLENRAVLSGDIGKPHTDEDNVYHVVIGISGAIIDGFTITGGNANGLGLEGLGGGMLNMDGASPTVRHVIVENNYAHEGGGVYNHNRAQARFEQVTIIANHARMGAGMVLRDSADAELREVTFEDNVATWRGGAVLIDFGSSPRFTDCVFAGNGSSGHGGAVWIDDSQSAVGTTQPLFERGSFRGNRAGGYGGAVAAFQGASATFVNVAFSDNQADKEGATLSARLHSTLRLRGTIPAGSVSDETSDISPVD